MALVFKRGGIAQAESLKQCFNLTTTTAREPGEWPTVGSSDKLTFDTFKADRVSHLSGKTFSSMITDASRHQIASWMVHAWQRREPTDQPTGNIPRFAQWALGTVFCGLTGSLLKLKMPPSASEPLPPGGTLEGSIQAMGSEARALCESFLGPLLQLSQDRAPPCPALVAGAVRGGLLAQWAAWAAWGDGKALWLQRPPAAEPRGAHGFPGAEPSLGALAEARRNRLLGEREWAKTNLNNLSARQVEPGYIREWVFACFARDLHILLRLASILSFSPLPQGLVRKAQGRLESRP